MLIKVFCVVSMLSKLPPVVCLRGGGGATGLLNKGGGSNRLPVEFPQIQTSYYKSNRATRYTSRFVWVLAFDGYFFFSLSSCKLRFTIDITIMLQCMQCQGSKVIAKSVNFF